MGVQLLSFAKLDYVTKGRGGTGTDGITWKPLAESTIKAKARKGSAKRNRKRTRTKSGKARPGKGANQIGVDSGLQLASMAPGFRGDDGKGGNFLEVLGNQVTVGVNRTYSEHFDRERPIFPTELPASWQPPLEKIVDRWANKILSDSMGNV